MAWDATKPCFVWFCRILGWKFTQVPVHIGTISTVMTTHRNMYSVTMNSSWYISHRVFSFFPLSELAYPEVLQIVGNFICWRLKFVSPDLKAKAILGSRFECTCGRDLDPRCRQRGRFCVFRPLFTANRLYPVRNQELACSLLLRHKWLISNYRKNT